MRPETIGHLVLLFAGLVAFFASAVHAGYPQRIVSCGPTITEKLYLLGLERNIAGVTVYCQRPTEARNKPKIGSVTQISVEKVVSLKPDLVLATPLTDSRSIKKLKDLAIRVVLFTEPKSFRELNDQFIEMGRLTGKEQVARDIVRMAERRVKRIGTEVKGLPRPRVFLQIGANPLFTASKETVLNDFIEFSGAINMVEGFRGGIYSRERVLAENPDTILIVAMEGAVAENEKARWQKFGTLKAVRDGAIYVMDPYKMCSPTPITFVEALEDVVKIIHPKRRKEVVR